jgi:hypothetical protein
MSDDDDGLIVHEFEMPFHALHIVSEYSQARDHPHDRATLLNTVAAWLSFAVADHWDDVPEDDQIAWLDEHEDCCAGALRALLARVEAECRRTDGE